VTATTSGARNPLTLTGGIFLFIGIIGIAVSAFVFYQDWRFANHARTVRGIVITKDIRISRSDTSSSRSTTRHYEATYRFTVDGATFEGRDELTQAAWAPLNEGGPADVLYMPGRPSSNRLAGARPWVVKVVFGIVGTVFTIIGGVMLRGVMRRAALEARLRERGLNARAKVIEVSATAWKVNGVQQWRLRYEYEDRQGGRHVRSETLAPSDAQQWKAGDVGGVRYDPSSPRDAMWIGRG
jgi:hypothetical protein